MGRRGDQAHASSFQPDALTAARAAELSLPRALLLDSLRDGWLAEAQNLGCVAIVANCRVLDVAAISQAHAAGLRVASYTVNDAAEATRLRHAGIDGLIIDAVDLLAPLPH